MKRYDRESMVDPAVSLTLNERRLMPGKAREEARKYFFVTAPLDLAQVPSIRRALEGRVWKSN